MGWWSRLAGVTEHLKLDVLMQLDIRSGQGGAALCWTVVRPHPWLSDEQCRIALVALLYARTLVNNKETRVELFDRMARAAGRVLEGDGKLTFEPWRLHVFRRDFSIWPWTFTEPGRIAAAKTYTATLQSMTRGSLAIHLKMALGQDRVLAPSSALIATSGLAAALNDRDRARLARVLLGINSHYQSPERIGLRSEPGALAAAMPALGVREAPPHPTASTTMNLTPGGEEPLWARVGVSRIIDIPGFPFLSYDAFKAAVTKGDAQLGIEYAAARGLVRVTKSPAAALLVLGLSWVTPLLALLSLILPFSTRNWWALGGVASSFLGQALANPYNPLKGLIGLAVIGAIQHAAFARTILQPLLGQLVANPSDPVGSLTRLAIKLAVIGALLHVAFAGTLLKGPAWISFCFAVSAIVLWVLNHLAWSWAHTAALRSEALAALLFKTHSLHIRDRQGKFHDAEPPGAA